MTMVREAIERHRLGAVESGDETESPPLMAGGLVGASSTARDPDVSRADGPANIVCRPLHLPRCATSRWVRPSPRENQLNLHTASCVQPGPSIRRSSRFRRLPRKPHGADG